MQIYKKTAGVQVKRGGSVRELESTTVIISDSNVAMHSVKLGHTVRKVLMFQ